MNIDTHTECRQVTILAGVAKKDLPKGTKLVVEGHHHFIEGLTPQLLERNSGNNIATFYLLNENTLLKEVKAGSPITLDDDDLSQSIKNCVNF